jgi:hypothetical protein
MHNAKIGTLGYVVNIFNEILRNEVKFDIKIQCQKNRKMRYHIVVLNS